MRALRYPLLWERVAAEGLGFTDAPLAEIQRLGIASILGLVHNGSGPDWTSLVDHDFTDGLAAHAALVAARYPWVRDWTPSKPRQAVIHNRQNVILYHSSCISRRRSNPSWRLSVRSMILLALAGISLPTRAHAADAAAPADIIVTSSRQPYRGDFTAQETPAAITIIDRTWLANTNVLRLTDALDLN
ncbi:MAG: hypothetical protein ACK5SX_02580, partial [Sandaracinobacter sp.]